MASHASTEFRNDPLPEVSPSRQEEVLAAISAVRDPEIDETVVSLDFIMGVDVDGDAVTVSLRLPTFWCPANFVFLMAHDMRAAVTALPWVASFNMKLVDHFAADEINRSVNEGLGFEQVFPQASQGLDKLRRSFDEKTFLMRQGSLLRHLRGKGFDDGFLLRVDIGELDPICARDDAELGELWAAYLEKRRKLGLPCGEASKVAADAEGNPVEDLGSHLRMIRSTATNAGANGEMCRMLVAARREGGCGAFRAEHTRR